MERESKTITLKNTKKEVVLKAWITGREKRDIMNAYAEISGIKSGEQNVQITGDLMNKMQDKMVETVVVSIDGNTENLAEQILDLPSKDTDQVINEVSGIINIGDEEKKG